ncbi:MAG: anti-sigma factor antagonist [Anaerolineae bacterium]|nr:anti-sigma factor antagonist [Anaerolineae bacterium]
MQIEITHSGESTIITLVGDIDSSSAPDIQDALSKQIHENASILLDMTGVTFLSSFGLRHLLLLKREVVDAKGQIVLVGLSDPVANVMEVTGFSSFFDIYETVEDGLAGLSDNQGAW